MSDTTRLELRMREGHLLRCGHELEGEWVGSGYERSFQRTCCETRA